MMCSDVFRFDMLASLKPRETGETCGQVTAKKVAETGNFRESLGM